MSVESWQKYEIPGPSKATVIVKPEMVPALIKRVNNPILVVGHEAAEIPLGKKAPIDYIIRIAKAANIPVVTTAHTIGKFLDRDFEPTASMTAMDIGNRLKDPNWSITDGKDSHDLALILGLPYYMGWVIESGLKSFAYKHLKMISLDRYYQPHCNWSFPNLSLENWKKNLEIIAKEVEKK
jgi:CO dehydrogenase/acetyl-CoA synthase complex epsilon subunit